MRVARADAFVLAVAAATAHAEDWPQWRGRLGTGVPPERSLPTKGEARQAAWRAELLAFGAPS